MTNLSVKSGEGGWAILRNGEDPSNGWGVDTLLQTMLFCHKELHLRCCTELGFIIHENSKRYLGAHPVIEWNLRKI